MMPFSRGDRYDVRDKPFVSKRKAEGSVLMVFASGGGVPE
jgi:hypothetical protein